MSNIDPKAVCGNCLYFAKDRAECRRYAPRGGSEEDRIWPQVRVQEWCSEHKYNGSEEGEPYPNDHTE